MSLRALLMVIYAALIACFTASLPWQAALVALSNALGLPSSAHSSSRHEGQLCLRREVTTVDGSIRSRYCRI